MGDADTTESNSRLIYCFLFHSVVSMVLFVVLLLLLFVSDVLTLV